MANELAFPHGIPVTLDFELANPGAGATTAMTFGGQGGNGFLVPAGYAFHPIYLSDDSNADLTAGTATAKVRDNGTEIANGPEPQLADTVQRAAALCRVGACPIAAGHFVTVSLTTTAGYLPVTADHTARLIGLLLPA